MNYPERVWIGNFVLYHIINGVYMATGGLDGWDEFVRWVLGDKALIYQSERLVTVMHPDVGIIYVVCGRYWNYEYIPRGGFEP